MMSRALILRTMSLLPSGQRGVEIRGADAVGGQCVYLILHQGDQGRNDHRKPIKDHGGYLVAKGFPAAGRHKHQRILLEKDMLDDRLLLQTERTVAEMSLEYLNWTHGRAFQSRSSIGALVIGCSPIVKNLKAKIREGRVLGDYRIICAVNVADKAATIPVFTARSPPSLPQLAGTAFVSSRPGQRPDSFGLLIGVAPATVAVGCELAAAALALYGGVDVSEILMTGLFRSMSARLSFLSPPTLMSMPVHGWICP